MNFTQLVKLSTLVLALISALVSCETIRLESHQVGPHVSNSRIVTLSTSSNAIRLRANRLRRPEQCKENLPKKFDDLPELVIIAKIKEVYTSLSSTLNSLLSSQQDATNNNNNQTVDQQLKALVNVARVFKGNQRLEGSNILVTGFNTTSSTSCPNYIKPNDTVILLLNSEASDRSYAIQNGNLLSMSLNNLDKINAIVADEQFKRRSPIEDILCEAHYCPYGRCKVSEQQNSVSCECPDICTMNYSPVCGSDNTTYP